MPKAKISIRDIQGLTPAIDARQTEGATFVLSGQNFIMDSAGVRSAFASRLIARGVSIDPSPDGANVQSQAGLIFTKSHAGQFVRVTGGQWAFATRFVYPQRISTTFAWRKWTSAFSGNALYVAHPSVGLWRLSGSGAVQIDPGIAGPQAVTESNGRLIVLGSTAIAWSGPGSPEDFVPALGGAGFQVLSERIAGNPFMLTSIASGFITWTDGGALVSEFIAGDLSFRHYIARHSHRPISDLSYVRMPDDSYLICTKQGLFVFNDTQQPSPATPVFNEFLRGIFANAPEAGLRVRLDYDRESDLLYVQIRNNASLFNKTFVLAVAIDKWGSFDVKHQGIIQHGILPEPVRGLMGYIDSRGRAHRFLPFGVDRETAPGVFTGLASGVVLGPFRVPELQQFADVEQELQGFYLGNNGRPAWSNDFLVNIDENLDTVQGGSVIDDGSGPFVGQNSIVDETDPFIRFPVVSNTVTVISDWSGFDPGGFTVLDVFSGGPGNRGTDIGVANETVPILVRDQATASYWDVLAPGIWHRLRIGAFARGQFYHISYGELTFSYSGRLGT